jgi:hypothetical protein
VLEVILQWVDWRDHNLPPSREMKGRGGQNPILWDAFRRFREIDAQIRSEQERTR